MGQMKLSIYNKNSNFEVMLEGDDPEVVISMYRQILQDAENGDFGPITQNRKNPEPSVDDPQ